jgi:hypothetical protein
MIPRLPSLQHVTVASAILGAAYAAIRYRATLSLEIVVGKLLAASSIPAGLFLLACAFDTTLASKLSGDLGLYFGAAGVALLYVSVKELVKP